MEMTPELFFQLHPRCAVAFSGGCDSAYLLRLAKDCGAEVHAYFIKTVFQPESDLRRAESICRSLGIPLTIVSVDILSSEQVSSNPPDRCYYCKTALFSALRQAASGDGYSILLDGTNASDDASDRPGMRALKELEVLSPLRECGLTKSEIRQRSHDAGLSTWDLPACACLATRIPTGERITEADLQRVSGAEEALRSMGFSDLRVRMRGSRALIQLPAGQHSAAKEKQTDITNVLSPYFETVELDPQPRNGLS